MRNPRILALGTANPPHRFTQEETYRLAGYHSERILEIFRNSDIDGRYFFIDPGHLTREETPDELNQRYLRGAMETGSRAVERCLESAGLTTLEVDLLLVCTCTGYVCPDLARLAGWLGGCDSVGMCSEHRCSVWAAPGPYPRSSEPGTTRKLIPVAGP